MKPWFLERSLRIEKERKKNPRVGAAEIQISLKFFLFFRFMFLKLYFYFWKVLLMIFTF